VYYILFIPLTKIADSVLGGVTPWDPSLLFLLVTNFRSERYSPLDYTRYLPGAYRLGSLTVYPLGIRMVRWYNDRR
jgi:hypothetical protein